MKANLGRGFSQAFRRPRTSVEVGPWLTRKLIPLFAAESRRVTLNAAWRSSMLALLVGFTTFAYLSFSQNAAHDGLHQGFWAAGLAMAVSSLIVVVFYGAVQGSHQKLLHAALVVAQNNVESLVILGKLIELRDPDTGGHNLRVTIYALMFSEALGMPPETIMRCTKGALLHDIGKLVVPDQILGKPGPLTPDERRVMQTHVEDGIAIVTQACAISDAEPVVGGHHERYDGTGYPRGLKGQEIPCEARIFALIDVFDALISRRVYKSAIPISDALAMMQKERGLHFDPALLDRFVELAPGFLSQLPQEEDALLAMLMERVSPYLRSVLPKQMPVSIVGANLLMPALRR